MPPQRRPRPNPADTDQVPEVVLEPARRGRARRPEQGAPEPVRTAPPAPAPRPASAPVPEELEAEPVLAADPALAVPTRSFQRLAERR